MVFIQADEMDHRAINDAIRAQTECTVTGCLGQRFIASGMNGKKIHIEGIPGNALGAYLTGAEIIVDGNAQDAVGDTMNDGSIIIHGNAGDAVGYAMRGGSIMIRGNAGYRAGIHMKEYREKKPLIIIGGRAGSFLGEYQAGGLIVVLGMHDDGKPIVGNFPCTGMHGGKMFLRGNTDGISFPANVTVSEASEENLKEIMPCLEKYCEAFGLEPGTILAEKFTLVVPDTGNPYKQMYVAN